MCWRSFASVPRAEDRSATSTHHRSWRRALRVVIASYFRAFVAVETQLDEFDARVMASTPRTSSRELARLVELRRSVGVLRRGLSPHREIVVALEHPEARPAPTEISAERFAALESRVTQALDAARVTKESIFGSFDLLVARNGQRTNEIVKVLTLATVVLLPAALLAGIMGMNFKVGLFNQAWLFWAVIAAMFGIAVLVLSVARSRRWYLGTAPDRPRVRTARAAARRESATACATKWPNGTPSVAARCG